MGLTKFCFINLITSTSITSYTTAYSEKNFIPINGTPSHKKTKAQAFGVVDSEHIASHSSFSYAS